MVNVHLATCQRIPRGEVSSQMSEAGAPFNRSSKKAYLRRDILKIVFVLGIDWKASLLFEY